MTDSEFHTATMARLYAQQGHFQKAADIYRHILLNEPNRADIAAELSEVERQLNHLEPESERDVTGRDLAPLFQKWFQMAAAQGRIEILKKIKQQLKGL